MIFKRLKEWYQSYRYFVIVDPNDNSVTLSKALYHHISNNAMENEDTRVFVFKVSHNDNYGFMISPSIERETQMSEIQYNDKYRCVGFETLCPSVGLILYNYGLDATKRYKFSVSIHSTLQGKLYYQIDKPHEKYIRKYKKG